MPVAFDTLKAAKRLQDEAGFSEKQAGVLVSTLAEGVGENLATKADIEAESRALRSEMQAMDERTQAGFAAMRAEIQALDERTQAEFKAVRSEMQAMDERTQAEFKAVRSEMQVIRSEMQASDERTQAGFAAMRSEMQVIRAEGEAREQRLMLHMGRLVVGGVGVILASIGIVTAIILAAG